MKNNKKKTTHSSSFGRLWSYLQVYRFPLYLAIFLKIISVIMSVIEPVDVYKRQGILKTSQFLYL